MAASTSSSTADPPQSVSNRPFLTLPERLPAVLRPGGVLIADLQKVAPEIVQINQYTDAATPTAAPGQMLKHYAPQARVLLYTQATPPEALRQKAQTLLEAGETVGVLTTTDDQPAWQDDRIRCIALGPANDLNAISRGLFDAMRQLDLAGVAVILIRDFGREGVGEALWDRLYRAAEGRVADSVSGPATE